MIIPWERVSICPRALAACLRRLASLASFATSSGAVVLLMESVREVYKVQDSREGPFLLAT